MLRIAFLFLACSALTSGLLAQDNKNKHVETLSELKGVYSADFNHDGSVVVTHGPDSRIGLWSTATGAAIQGDLNSENECIHYLLDRDHKVFVAIYKQHKPVVYDATTGLALSPALDVESIGPWADKGAFSPDLTSLVFFDDSHTPHVLDVLSGRNLKSLHGETKPSDDTESSLRTKFTADGAYCFIMDTHGVVTRYETKSWKPVGTALSHPYREGYSYGFSTSDDSSLAVTHDGPGENGPKGHLQLWDVSNGKPIGKSFEAQNGLTGRFLPDNRLLISPGRGKATVHEIPSLKKLYELRQHDDVEGPRVAVSQDKKRLLCWGYDGSLDCCDVDDGKYLGGFHSKAQIRDVLLSNDLSHCHVVLDNTSFMQLGYHDWYLIKLSLPDLKTVKSIRVLDWLSDAKVSSNGLRLMVRQGWSGREKVRIFDGQTLEEIQWLRAADVR